MPSERVQRQIDGLLDEAEAAARALDWTTVRRRIETVLAFDPENADARTFLDAAARAGASGSSTAASQPAAVSDAPSAPPLPASFAGGRYAVRRFLGEGGRKRVYLAHDARLRRDVAVAVIKTEGLDEAGLARVRRESEALGQLGDHPHIVTIHDSGEDAGPDGQSQAYIVSQYMAGGSVEDLIRDAADHRLPTADILRIAVQVCRALEYAHGRGIIHRDLKPGNVWLSADGSANVGDFGLAKALDRSRLTLAGTMLGSAAYMPPEQAVGGEVTPRADLYSLGCMLYEMVAGRPPFIGDDPTAVISQHINTPPVAPSWLTEHCPPDLEELILRLLAKDPGARPESAAEVLAALERVDPAQKSASHSESNALERLARRVFVGRERELERLRKTFDEAVAGRGGLLMLVGEPGIGKTRAAQELETYARMRGAQVLWGRAHESAGAPAYWPWLQVGNQYTAAHLDDLQTLIGPQMPPGAVSELSRIFPWLKQQAANFVEPEEIADPEAAQFRLFDAYASYLRAIANQAPLLIALDDLHWADKPSLELLQHVARELARMRVLIVCTYRDTDLSRTHPLSEALAVLNREAGFQRVVLRGLSRDEVAGYIRAAANVTPRPELLDRIFEETEGNPFFLSEVVNLLAQEGKLTESVSDIAVPDGVREALGRRLDRVSEEANELLQTAAVVGREFTYQMLTLMRDRSEEELLRLIEETLEARVIEEMDRPGRYRFTHALMQETLLDELSTTRRVRIHGQVGEALERRWGARADERATRLALHFVEAAMLSPRHAAKAVHYARLAAGQAEAQFAWDEAAAHYEHCLTLIGDASDSLGEDEAALLVAMGICARNGGSFRPAWRALMRAITLYRERGDGIGVARATVEALWIPSPVERYVPLVRDALEALASSDPYLEARLLDSVVWNTDAFQPQETADAQQRLLQLLDAHNFEDVRASIVGREAGRAAGEGAFERAAQLAADAYERFAALGQVRPAAGQLFNRSLWLLGAAGLLGQGREAADEALAHARRHRLVYFERVAADLVASVQLARCEFEAFDRASEERGADTVYLMDLLRATRAEMTGNPERAVAALPDPASAGVNPGFVTQLLAGRARVLLNAGREREAREDYRRVRETIRGMLAPPMVNGIAVSSMALGLDEALTALGDDAFVRAMHEAGQIVYDVSSGGSMTRMRGAIALHLGEIDAAEERFSEALAWCERERCPVEAGRCLAGLAEVADRRGDSAASLQLLDRAAALFREHGAKLYLDRVIAKKLELQGVTSGGIYTSIDAVARAVEHERPPLPQQAVAPDGTVTIMFSDIEDSTALTERLGDQAWMELLRKHDALIRKELRAYDGFEVKTIGDAFMVAFQSAKKGLDCAIAIQRAFADHNAAAGEHVKVRIGLHAGEAIKDGDDFYGKNVILASRVAGKANGGEILVSSLLRSLVESSTDSALFGAPQEVELKGLSGAHVVYAVAST